jgi:hypothetical protein
MNRHQKTVINSKRAALLCASLAVSAVGFLPSSGVAQVVSLTGGGSSATVDLGSGAGMDNWSVLGQNQLMQQWFWYRTDNGIAQPINTISAATISYQSSQEVDAVYANSQLSIEVDYVLSGGGVGSGNADMTETILAKNLSGSSLNLNLYEYSYFNLLQSGNNNVQIFGGPGAYSNVQQTSGSTSIQETIVSPYANDAEAAYYNQTLNELNTQSGLVLNGNTSVGPGNVTWSFQWSNTLAANGPGSQLNIFKDKNLSIAMVPEPSTVALISLGLGALGLSLRRKLS